jgi:hypothetical protein
MLAYGEQYKYRCYRRLLLSLATLRHALVATLPWRLALAALLLQSDTVTSAGPSAFSRTTIGIESALLLTALCTAPRRLPLLVSGRFRHRFCDFDGSASLLRRSDGCLGASRIAQLGIHISSILSSSLFTGETFVFSSLGL